MLTSPLPGAKAPPTSFSLVCQQDKSFSASADETLRVLHLPKAWHCWLPASQWMTKTQFSFLLASLRVMLPCIPTTTCPGSLHHPPPESSIPDVPLQLPSNNSWPPGPPHISAPNSSGNTVLLLTLPLQTLRCLST